MKIALVGNQNSGKTTLFNLLTGTNQKIGNWPGVTIETQADTQKFNITVKAENGEENTYEITINKVTDLGITSIKANDVECEKENGTYITYIDKGVTEVGLTIVPNNPIALVSTKVGTDDFSKAEANNTHIINIPKTKE